MLGGMVRLFFTYWMYRLYIGSHKKEEKDLGMVELSDLKNISELVETLKIEGGQESLALMVE